MREVVQVRRTRDYGLSEEEKQTYGDRVPNHHLKLEVLGKGGFAIVWLCVDNRVQERVAMK